MFSTTRPLISHHQHQNTICNNFLNFRILWLCIVKVGWRERNQQDATNLMFIIKLLSQHVSGIITPIIRRTRPCTTAYGILHWLCWPWLCGAGTRATASINQCRTPYAVPQSWSPEDGQIDARNMLRYKFDNKDQISCILFIFLSSPYWTTDQSESCEFLHESNKVRQCNIYILYKVKQPHYRPGLAQRVPGS